MRLMLALLAICSTMIAAAHQSTMVPGHGFPPAYLPGIKLSKEIIFSTTRVISDDMEMSAVISTANASSYIYLHGSYGPLTLLMRPCSSSVNVTVYHVAQNTTGLLKNYIQGRSDSPLATSKGMKLHVFSWKEAPAGLYLIDLVAEHSETVVNLYATSLPSLPAALRIKQQPRVRIQPRLHRNRVTLRWDQSVVDPQMMHYCVVVNSKRNFSSLCEARYSHEMNVYATFGKSPKLENKIHKKANSDTMKTPNKTHHSIGQQLGKDDVFITCVGTSLSYTISNLQRGRDYYFNIFAENRQTHLSFLYGSKALKYDPKVRPLGLRDNKPIMVNIRRLGGKALFRFKVTSAHSYTVPLSWHVMPCGGAVQVEVSLHHQVVIPRQTVEGYGHLQVTSPTPGRYVLLVYVAEPDQMRQVLGVEVLATMKTSPLPQLPSEASIYEYSSLRTCDSVTVGWIPTPTQSVRYCVSASPVSITESEGHFRPHPNQCNLDNRLRSQFDFAVKQCQDFSANDNRNVLIETVTKLRPGKEYLIQVTVKKIKGKALSYDLLRVRTKSKC